MHVYTKQISRPISCSAAKCSTGGRTVVKEQQLQEQQELPEHAQHVQAAFVIAGAS